MKFLTTFIFVILLFTTPFFSFSQKTVQASPPGISEFQWKQFDHTWERRRVDLIVTKKDSQLVEGQLLAASPEGIWVWPEKTLFTPKRGLDKIIYIPAEELYKLKLSQNHTFWQGAGVGGIIGGSLLGGFFISKSDGVYTPYALTGSIGFVLGGLVAGSVSGWVYKASEIQKEFLIESKTSLLASYAKEFSKLAIFANEEAFNNVKKISDEISSEELLTEIRESSKVYKKLFPRHNIHITGRMGIGYSPAQDQILNALGAEGIMSDYSNTSIIFPSQFEASINIIPQIRVGATTFSKTRTRAGRDQRGMGGGALDFSTSLQGYGGFIEYIPMPIDPFFKRKGEFSVGIGLYQFELGAYSFLDDGDYEKVDFLDKDRWFERKELGLHLRTGYEYYVSRYISIQLQGQAYLVKPLEVDRWEVQSDIMNEPLFLPDFRVNLSSINTSLGLRFHIPVR